jgi:amino acid permease
MDEPPNITLWNSYILIINCIIGAGVLSIPWAYSKGGIVIGISCQIYSSLTSLIICYQALQIISRVHKIKRLQSEGYKVSPVPIFSLFTKTHPKQFLKLDSKSEEIESFSESELAISDHICDATEMVNILLGNTQGIIYNVFFSISMFFSLVAYSSIFSSSLASIIPIGSLSTCNIYDDPEYFGDSCWRKYWFYVSILLIITSFLSLIKLKEQIWFQGTMTVLRFTVIALIIVTCSVALVQDKNLDDDDENEGDLNLFDLNAFGITMPIIIFSNSFQYFIPNAIQWMEYKKKNAPLLMNLSILTVSIGFIGVGTIMSFAVKDVDQMVTLEWDGYTGGHSEASWWSNIIGFTVIIFPALDMLSIFPLVSINLSDNLMTILEIEYKNQDLNNLKVSFVRLGVNTFPILVSVFFYKVGYIGDFAGIFSIACIGIYFPLMALASKRIVTQSGEYDKWFNQDWHAWSVLISQFIIIILCTVLLILWVT